MFKFTKSAYRAALRSTLVLLVACGSDSQKERPYVGRLLQEVVLHLPDGMAASLTPEQRAALEVDGAQLDLAQNVLRFPRSPLKGRVIKSGELYVVTNAEGLFRLPDLPNSVVELEVFRETQDAAREAVFPVNPAGYGDDESKAPELVKREELPVTNLPMNGPEDVGAARELQAQGYDAHHGGTRVLADNCSERCKADAPTVVADAEGCCQDYDGPLGDKLPRARDDADPVCQAKAYRNFPNSTCAQWSTGQISSACSNESAYQCKIHAGSPQCSPNKPKCSKGSDCPEGTTCFAGSCLYPSCYLNHKYRNCQNLDPNGLGLAPYPTVTVAPGQSIDITLQNKTEANETLVGGLTGNGSLVMVTPGPKLITGPTPIILHYSDGLRKHFSTVKLKYTAPKDDAKQCIPGGKKVVLTFSIANSAPKAPTRISLTIVIKKPGKALMANGRAAEECPDPDDDEDDDGSDLLTVTDTIAEWTRGDAIAPGPGNLVVSGSGTVLNLLEEDGVEVARSAISSSGGFSFTADCSGGNGPCASAGTFKDLCGFDSTPAGLRVLLLELYEIDALYQEGIHARPGGGMWLTPRPPREVFGVSQPEIYSWLWADRRARVAGNCKGNAFNLTLKKGWNAFHVGASGYNNAPPPEGTRWYFINPLTASPGP